METPSKGVAGVVRTIRYFLRNAKTNLGALLAFAAVVTVGAVVTGVPDGANNLFGTYYGCFPLMSLMVLFLLSFALCTSCLNLALSFGGRRVDYFWALQVNMALCAGAATVMQAAMSAIPHLMGWQDVDRWTTMLSLSGQSPWIFFLIALCLQVLGGMCGLLQTKSKVLWAIVLVAVVLVGIGAVVLLLLSSNHGTEWWDGLPLIFGAALLLGAVVGEAVLWQTIRCYTVR